LDVLFKNAATVLLEATEGFSLQSFYSYSSMESQRVDAEDRAMMKESLVAVEQTKEKEVFVHMGGWFLELPKKDVKDMISRDMDGNTK
jgi:hypothetical protein